MGNTHSAVSKAKKREKLAAKLAAASARAQNEPKMTVTLGGQQWTLPVTAQLVMSPSLDFDSDSPSPPLSDGEGSHEASDTSPPSSVETLVPSMKSSTSTVGLSSLSSQDTLSLTPQSSCDSMSDEPRAENAILRSRHERHFYNSTATVFVDTTLQDVKLTPLLKAIAALLVHEMSKDVAAGLEPHPVFDERDDPLEPYESPDVMPTVAQVESYLQRLFKALALHAEPALIMLVYIDRIHQGGAISNGAAVLPQTWRRIVLGAIMAAAKVWEDLAVWNADFKHVEGLRPLTTSDLGELERLCLFMMDFNVNVKANAYAQCYFTVREFAITRNIEFHDIAIERTAKQLERSSRHCSKEIRKQYRGRVAVADLHMMRRSVSDRVFVPGSDRAAPDLLFYERKSQGALSSIVA